MRKKVGYNELRLPFFFAEADFYLRAVTQNDYAVERHRNRCPLIFLDSAVVVGLEKSNLVCFIERVRLKVKPGRINMSRCDSYTLADAFFADNGKDNRFFTVEIVNLVAGCVLLEFIKGNEALFLCLGNNKFCDLSLSFVIVEKFFVILGEIHRLLKLCFINKICAVLFVHKQFFAQNINFCLFFCHCDFLLKNSTDLR